MNSHAKWLRQAAKEIAAQGHNGWGNTCSDAAGEIDSLENAVAHWKGMTKGRESEIDQRTDEIGQMRTVLQDIAGQSKSDEFGDDRDDADFEGAYDIMIQLARSVTTKVQDP